MRSDLVTWLLIGVALTAWGVVRLAEPPPDRTPNIPGLASGASQTAKHG